MIRILFVGESWFGSCARTLKEAIARHAEVELDEVSEDHFAPRHRAKWLRGLHRLLRPFYRKELYRQVRYRLAVFKPDIVMTYKGFSLEADFLRQLGSLGVKTVNVYPDCSPHGHGEVHRKAVGTYDLVISTKPFHCDGWRSIYGYTNACEFVPQGYDPALHLVPTPPTDQPFDISMVATWRPEYGDFMKHLAVLLEGSGLKVAVGGPGWPQHRNEYPTDWVFGGELQGRSYIEWLRQGKICIALLNPEIVINGARQPGDQDTTRTYELAAAHCFFIHRRTDFVKTLYNETDEVPMFDDPEELAEKIKYFMARPQERARMAEQAHRRAVPSYSIDSRAGEILDILTAWSGGARATPS